MTSVSQARVDILVDQMKSFDDLLEVVAFGIEGCDSLARAKGAVLACSKLAGAFAKDIEAFNRDLEVKP